MRLKLSGYEPIFDLYPWIKSVNADNCYDYAIGDFEMYRNVKSTPGDRAGLSSNSFKVTSCKQLRQRILKDNKKTSYVCKNPNKVCKRGYYKIMSFVSPKGGDFHFYKQVKGVKHKVKTGDTVNTLSKYFRVKPNVIKKCGPLKPGKTITISVNLWAHKQGWGAPPLMTDAKGKTIVDPRKASRNYPGLNYSKFCNAFCIKLNKGRSGKNSVPGIRSL